MKKLEISQMENLQGGTHCWALIVGGAGGGATAGALAGASAGTFTLPLVGTVSGALVGGIAGGLFFFFSGYGACD